MAGVQPALLPTDPPSNALGGGRRKKNFEKAKVEQERLRQRVEDSKPKPAP